jgi:hypothetical protein
MTTAAATSGVAFGGNAVFQYNRANFMFDSGQRWARYMAGYTFAMDQVAMYREDVDQMADISVAKMDNIHAVSGLMMVIVIQLIMAGRLGVHGPAPPVWIMGMYWVNCGLMCMWLMMAAWFAIHGGARAQAGCAYLKTRSVRLPIPTPKQLDKARIYGNHWERQRVWDVFRVPFVTPAPVDEPVDHRADEDSDGEVGKKGGPPGKKTQKTRGDVTDFRTPGWVNEEIRELHGGSGGAPVYNGTTPEHFELFRGLQHEWWQHECYARISLFLAFTHWFSAASLYIQCHCFIELRAMWPAYSCTFVLVACHFCLNSVDIMRVPRDSATGFGFNVPMELVIPFPPLVTSILMGIDYSVLEEYRSGWVVFVWIVSFLLYFTYWLWSLRMYDLCRPSKALEAPDKKAGAPWWPGEWQLPVSFQHALYLVAPPKFLEPGESCLWQEMKAGRGNANNRGMPDSKQRQDPPNNAAWRICRGGNFVTIALWSFIIFGRLHAMAWVTPEGGDMRYMLKQEGRAVRWPSHMQPWITPWTRLGSRNEWCHTGGCDRRLGEQQWKNRHEMAGVAERLVPTLQTVSDTLEEGQSFQMPAAKPTQAFVPVARAAVDWPVGFRPELISCSHSGPVAAVARTQRSGALVHHGGAGGVQSLESFAFQGIDHLGEVLGSHWGNDGMLLTMVNGHLAECIGMPVHGVWPCQQTGSRLPLGGSSLSKAVAARIPNSKSLFRAAVVYEGEASVTLFESEDNSGVWFPTGEARLPAFLEQAPSFSMSMEADELILLTEGGGVLKWVITEPEPRVAVPPPREDAASHVVWQTACRLSDNRLARLGHKHSEGNAVPELFFSTGA